MAIKTFPILSALLAALLVAQIVSCDDENVQSDILFVENPDTDPVVITPTEALLDSAARNRVCNPATCQRFCRSRNFRFGRCNRNRVCVCSNS